MKIILSRKGFDSSNGGMPSPIMPNGELLSMPIPSDDSISYADLSYKGKSYESILKELNPKFSSKSCHLDPDIRENVRNASVDNWKPAFGQIGSAAAYLRSNVEVGDIILFFGWFRGVINENGSYKFCTPRHTDDFYKYADLQIIYGYMQIGAVMTDSEKIKKYYWHPHSSAGRLAVDTNALYIPSERLSFCDKKAGCGVLDYREDRVLTKKDRTRGIWNEHSFLMPDKIIGNRKNSSKSDGLYYAGVWQELAFKESDELTEWAKKIIL